MHQAGQRPSGKEASFAPFVRNTTRLSGQIQLTIFEKYCMRSRSLMVVQHQTIWQLGLFCSIWSFFHFKIQSFESFFQCCLLRNKWVGAGGSLYIVVPTNHMVRHRVRTTLWSISARPHFPHSHTLLMTWQHIQSGMDGVRHKCSSSQPRYCLAVRFSEVNVQRLQVRNQTEHSYTLLMTQHKDGWKRHKCGLSLALIKLRFFPEFNSTFVQVRNQTKWHSPQYCLQL